MGRAEPALADAIARLVRCLDSKDDGAVLLPGIMQEIIYRLLLSPFGTMIAEMGMAGSRTQRITRAIAHLKNQFAEPLRVTDLARLSGMSASTFHEHFRRITTLSPLQYQKQLRLQEARRLQAQSSLIGLRGSVGGHAAKAVEEHDAISQAIRAGDPEAAAQAAATHIDNTLDDYRREIQQRLFSSDR